MDDRAGRREHMEAAAHPIWAQAPDEPDKWFARFEVYRALGPARSLIQAYRLVAQVEGLSGRQPSGYWWEVARRDQWQARAAAWDAAEEAQRQPVEDAAASVERPNGEHENRRHMVNHLLRAVYRLLVAAEMDKMARDEARELLPMLRVFFKDLLAAHRAEAPPEDGDRRTDATLRADDLLAAQSALERWHAERKRLLEARNED
jgi:hypothetical protein